MRVMIAGRVSLIKHPGWKACGFTRFGCGILKPRHRCLLAAPASGDDQDHRQLDDADVGALPSRRAYRILPNDAAGADHGGDGVDPGRGSYPPAHQAVTAAL